MYALSKKLIVSFALKTWMGLIRQRVQRHLEAFALLRLQESVWELAESNCFLKDSADTQIYRSLRRAGKMLWAECENQWLQNSPAFWISFCQQCPSSTHLWTGRPRSACVLKESPLEIFAVQRTIIWPSLKQPSNQWPRRMRETETLKRYSFWLWTLKLPFQW